MSALRIVQVVCVAILARTVTPQVYDNTVEVDYPDAYYNEISDGEQNEVEAPTETPASPCTTLEFSKWDKLFTMLENSQMKENMLLQYSDDIVKSGLKSLRTELLEVLTQTSGSCTRTVESAMRRFEQHSEQKLTETLEGLEVFAHEIHVRHNSVVLEIGRLIREQANQLYTIEHYCKSNQVKKTRDLGKEDNGGLQAITTQLQELQEKVEIYSRATSRQILPAGCDMAVFFPMRSASMLAEVIPERSMMTRAFTVCMWIKPTQMLNKTVLFSYGTATNPLELQLLLSGSSAFFTVGGEADLVKAPGAATEQSWAHLCGTWSSEQGLASLWVNGVKAASAPGVAEGHEIPGDGVIVLGQEYSSPSLAKHFGFQDEFKEKSFTGKLSGVNAWDRVLDQNEIAEQARADGQTCGSRGNLVAWGVSQVSEEGGVKMIY